MDQKIETLSKESDILKLHISLSPGGDEYLEAQQHFNKEKMVTF
jgi:hypothetical protein